MRPHPQRPHWCDADVARARRRQRLPLLAALVLLASFAMPARAKPCGDDVAGRDVPCACGDVVVSDLSLTDDPVTRTVCKGDGLVVRAPKAAQGITIDLRGKTLRGSGGGTGLWVIQGGPGGAHIRSSLGPATLAGFRDGVVARGHNSLASIENLIVQDSGRDGVRLNVAGAAVHSVTVNGARRNGFAVGGHRVELSDTQAIDSGRFGYFVGGSDMILGSDGAAAVARGSGRAGFSVVGMGHRLADCVATGGKGDGLRLSGMQLEVDRCTVSGNAGDGIVGTGAQIRLAGNQADGNGGDGIRLFGMHLTDGGGNHGAGNRGGGKASPPVQCEIGGRHCVP